MTMADIITVKNLVLLARFYTSSEK